MENVSKWFDDFQALNDVDLTIYEGERIRHMWAIRLWEVDIDKMPERP